MAHQTWGPLEASGAVLFSTPGETEALVGELAQAETLGSGLPGLLGAHRLRGQLGQERP